MRRNWRVPMGHTWEARVKLDCLVPGHWPAFWAVNGDRCPTARWTSWGSTATSTGPGDDGSRPHRTEKTWENKSIAGLVDGAKHSGGCAGTRMGSNSGGITSTAPERPKCRLSPSVHGNPQTRWPFNNPGTGFRPCSTSRSGSVAARPDQLPVSMLVDWIASRERFSRRRSLVAETPRWTTHEPHRRHGCGRAFDDRRARRTVVVTLGSLLPAGYRPMTRASTAVGPGRH